MISKIFKDEPHRKAYTGQSTTTMKQEANATDGAAQNHLVYIKKIFFKSLNLISIAVCKIVSHCSN